MLFYILVFVFILAFIFVQEHLAKEQKWFCDVVVLIVLASLTGFRAMGGADFGLYYGVYENVPSFPDFVRDYEVLYDKYRLFNMEKGYLAYISFLKTYLKLSFYGYLVFQSLFLYTFIYLGLKRYMTHWGIFFFIFLYKMFFYETFVSMRQPITIVMFYMMMDLIYRRKAIKYYILLTFLVLPFHNGAIFLFLVYFINWFKLTKKRLIILNIIFIPTILIAEAGIDPISSFSFLMDFVSDPVMKQKAINYMGGDVPLSIFHTLEYFLVMFLLVLNYDSIIKRSIYASFIVKLFLILLPIMTLFRSNLFFRREIDYFVPTYAIILGYLCDIHRDKKWFIILGVALVSFYGFIRYIILFDGGAMMPYRTWLLNDSNNFFIF